MARQYKELKIWQKAVSLAVAVYTYTEHFPKSEIYGLTSQIRRSAVSVAANIAEGSERQSDKEFARFLRIARGSLAELETHAVISEKLAYFTQERFTEMTTACNEIGKMLNGLINKLESATISGD